MDSRLPDWSFTINLLVIRFRRIFSTISTRLLLVSKLVDNPVFGLRCLVLGPVPCALPPALLSWFFRWIRGRFNWAWLDTIWNGAIGDGGALANAFFVVHDVALVCNNALELVLVNLGFGEQLLALAGAHKVSGSGHCAFAFVIVRVWPRRNGNDRLNRLLGLRRIRRSRRWLAILSIIAILASFALRTLLSFGTSLARRTFAALRARLPIWTLSALRTSGTLWTGGALGTNPASRTLLTGVAILALLACWACGTDAADLAGLALGSFLALLALVALGAFLAIFTLFSFLA